MNHYKRIPAPGHETTRYLTRVSSIHQQAYDLVRIHLDEATELSHEVKNSPAIFQGKR